jgi:hypothetical protein
MRYVDLKGAHYIGADIVPDMITANRMLYDALERSNHLIFLAYLCRDCRGGGAPTSDDGVAVPKKPFGRPLVATSLILPSIPDWRATDTIATVPGRRQSGPAWSR